MGRGRYIYINDDIDEKLQKVSNRSKLINKLLGEHFDKDDVMQMDEEQLKVELKKNKLKKEFEKKLRSLDKND